MLLPRRAASGLLALGLGVLVALAPVAGAQEPPAPTPSVDTEAPVEVRVLTLVPRAPKASNEYFQVAGTLTNRGDEPLSSLQVRLKTGDVITSRGGLLQADREGSSTVGRGEPADARDTDLAPGASTRFDVRVRVADLRLRQLGAYPLDVEARAVVGGGSRREQVGLASTYLPSFEGSGVTRIAWLWPLVDVPRAAPDGVMVDDVLADSVAEGGRLQRLTAAARDGVEGACDNRPGAPRGEPAAPRPTTPCRAEPVPLTYVVDPALLSDLDRMRQGYQVREGGRTTPGSGAGAAKTWLDALAADLVRGDASVLALPWGDPDVVAVTRRAALRDEVQSATGLGERTVQDLTGATSLRGVVWPPAGGITGAALDALTATSSAVVLDAGALVDDGRDVGRTPSARAALQSAVSGPVTGLVLEPGLSQLLAPDTTQWDGPRLAEQRWVVESAMIAAERPNESRTLVVAPPRRGTLVPELVSAVLADSGRLPWLCPVPLADVVSGRDACTGLAGPAEDHPVEDRGTLEPPLDSSGELGAATLRTVEEVRARATQLTDRVLETGDPLATETRARLLRARLRTESSGWRGEPVLGRRQLELYREEVDRLRGRLRVTTGQRVTLTSSSGVVRVSIVNELDQPVTVAVQLTASNAARLGAETTEIVEVGRRTSRPIDVQVEAQTSGQFVVFAQLVDRERQPFGEPVQLVVRSTEYGRVALAVTGVGVAVLMVTVGVRITRRALRRSGDEPAG